MSFFEQREIDELDDVLTDWAWFEYAFQIEDDTAYWQELDY
jgi:hypothetical protein